MIGDSPLGDRRCDHLSQGRGVGFGSTMIRMRALMPLLLVGCTSVTAVIDETDSGADGGAQDLLVMLDLPVSDDFAGVDLAGADFARSTGDLPRALDMIIPVDMTPACGLQGEPCCSTPNPFTCTDSLLTCTGGGAGTCQACGHIGQPCCGISCSPGPACCPVGQLNCGCESGASCYQATCQACGGSGQSCCGGDPVTHVGGMCTGTCGAGGHCG